MKDLQKGSMVQLGVLIVALVIVGGVYVFVNQKKAANNDHTIIENNLLDRVNTYTNPRYGFELQYPMYWKFIEPSGTDQWAVRFYDSTQNPAPFSDEPADAFFIKTKCDANASKTWQKSEFNFSYREECVNGLGVVLSAISEESKVTLEGMLSTLKPLK